MSRRALAHSYYSVSTGSSRFTIRLYKLGCTSVFEGGERVFQRVLVTNPLSVLAQIEATRKRNFLDTFVMEMGNTGNVTAATRGMGAGRIDSARIRRCSVAGKH